MPRFMFLYKGEATDMSKMTPEQSQAIMDKWGVWMNEVGSALVDVGAPLGHLAASVLDNGSLGKPAPISGYSILEADDLEAAKKLTVSHPFLSDSDGKFAIDIYELLPTPM